LVLGITGNLACATSISLVMMHFDCLLVLSWDFQARESRDQG
jgi:hypothetical protein